MDPITRDACSALAEAFRYPVPGLLDLLEGRLAPLANGAVRLAAVTFLNRVRALSMGEWEELYTRTLDLNPPAAPYVGFQVWGESYRRGTFLAAMSRELSVAGIDVAGELPDHLVPVLRYLGAAGDPLPELLDALGPAVERMASALRSADPDNPYLELLAALPKLAQEPKEAA